MRITMSESLPDSVSFYNRRGWVRVQNGLYLTILVAILVSGCRTRSQDKPEWPASDSPPAWSATVIKLVNGEETESTRTFRSGSRLREEWVTQGQRWAQIWLPELNTSYLLSLDQQFYYEQRVDEVPAPDETPNKESALEAPSIERHFEERSTPLTTETHDLEDQTIQGYICAVRETKLTFAGGQVELTRSFRARDLNGLTIRTENRGIRQSEATEVITELREISLDVPEHVFTVPTEYKKGDPDILRSSGRLH